MAPEPVTANALDLPLKMTMNDVGRDRLTHIFETQRDPLFRFALRIASSREEALDHLQEAFLRAARNLDRLPEDDREARSWMFRVIENLSRDAHRRRQLHEFLHTFLPWRQRSTDPREALVARNAVHAALVLLPPRQRAVIALCELEEVSVADAAQTLGIAAVTVRWHLAEARKRLAKILGATP